MSFERALEQNPAAQRVGDVRLRFDSPLLLAEAHRPPAGLKIALLGSAGVACALTAVALLLLVDPPPLVGCALLGVASAGLVTSSARLKDRWVRRRRFTLDFAAHTLRLDFTRPPRGLPRSLVVPFSRVRALTILELPDGTQALTVDVALEPDDRQLREVLAAEVPPSQSEALGWLHRMLQAALGV